MWTLELRDDTRDEDKLHPKTEFLSVPTEQLQVILHGKTVESVNDLTLLKENRSENYWG